MSLSAGEKLGPYEILEPIGAGGMGEVYRAHDARVGRDVAIKLSAEQFTERFSREVHAVAALNHPNICHLYDVGPNFLVMELVEGPTLADRIREGAMPIEDALAIAGQVADALDAAHEKGIVHRDLKPANIKITPAGVVKVLDFGLATIAPPAGSPSSDPASSPTLTMTSAQAGLIMGTAPYMSPEQARGKPVDKRADIWAFGVVLYEMLAGKPLFHGETVSDILAGVIKEEPSLETMPAHLKPVIEKCLRKDARRRWRDIGDVRIALEEARPSATVALSTPHKTTLVVAWLVAALLALALAGALLFLAPRPQNRPLMRLPLDLGSYAAPQSPNGSEFALSPDGSKLAFGVKAADGQVRLAVRALDQAQPTILAGTDGARLPFFSPDGKWIGFAAGGKLKKISIDGGAATALCDAPNFRGAAWTEDGFIIAALDTRGPLVRITETGGFFKPITELDKKTGEATHRWPQVLPGGKTILFTSHTTTGNYEDATIAAQSLTTGQRSVLWKGGSYGRYVPSGHLLFVHAGSVFAAPMDLKRLKLTGDPSPVVEAVASNAVSGGAGFDFARNGAFVFQGGEPTQHESIYWISNSAAPQLVATIPGAFTLRTAPDGQRFALSISEGSSRDVWIYDSKRETKTRLTFDGVSDSPVWAPDGAYIVFTEQHGDTHEIRCVRADGVGERTRLFSSASSILLGSFSPDGKHFAFTLTAGGTGTDIWTMPIEQLPTGGLKAGAAALFLQTPFNEVQPEFSPDGRWIAYMTDETGRQEVYVQAFPGPGGRWQISSGGHFPLWSRNGRELFYISQDRLMVVSYRSDHGAFVAEKPRLWKEDFVNPSVYRRFDLAPDGKRFAELKPLVSAGGRTPDVTFLLNFFDELQRRVPTKR